MKATQLVVLGGGPGGYSAAFRAADLGLQVTIIDSRAHLGGVCLNVGCIPSKALLHIARVMADARQMREHGVDLGTPVLDLALIRQWKSQVVAQLAGGLRAMAQQRNIEVVQGYGRFSGPNTVRVNETEIRFDAAIIAAGSEPLGLPLLTSEDPRVMDSTTALELADVPPQLLILGGGIIGLEMATIYQALGSAVTIVEYAAQLIPAADSDLLKAYSKHNKTTFRCWLSTKVEAVRPADDGLYVSFSGVQAPAGEQRFDKLLVAVGRKANGHLLDVQKAGLTPDAHGVIAVDAQQRTLQPHIFAIGDVTGQPMLAHKASHEGHVAAEVVAGLSSQFKPRCIPSVAYTDPEIAWVGLTEQQAKERGIAVRTATFPWSASARALASARSEGFTKLLADAHNRLVGGAIVGINAGEMIGELALAIELEADIEDIALTIHAHPTLNESIGLAAELHEGSVTDLPNPAAKKR